MGFWFYENTLGFIYINHDNYLQVCGHLVQEAEVRVWPAQSQPQDCLQGELQVRGPGEVSSQPGSHHAAAGRGVLEVTRILIEFSLDMMVKVLTLEILFPIYYCCVTEI